MSDSLPALSIGSAVPRRGNRVTRWLGRWLLRRLGLRVTGGLPDAPRVMVIGAPHTSNWDGAMAIGVALAYSLDVRVVAKAALLRWPFAGLLRWMGVIGIDRSAAGGVVGELTELYRRSDALWVCMSPEGTRAGAATWKTGFYRIAQAADVPILVLVFDWAAGEVRAADSFRPTGDYPADLARILSHYHGVTGRLPQRLSGPLRALAQAPEDTTVVDEVVEAVVEELADAPDAAGGRS